MAFTASTFVPQSSMANSDSARVFSYVTGTDTLAATKASGYFDDAAALTGGLGLTSGDFILVDASDGQSFLFMGVNPSTGVATTASANDFV